jgi:Zn-dependent protease with chaperone function/type II secretory pathway pseudopilin PulG
MRIQYAASTAAYSGATGETHLNDPLVHPRERTLGTVTLVLGLIGWLVLIVGTVGIALVYVLLGFLFYLFAHSALISRLRGNGVLLSAQQLPDLRDRFDACCATLGLDRDKPEAYLLQGGGVLNAFATRFLGRNYVVLLSDVVDAMKAHPDGINFYIGHELGHVRMHHLTGKLWRAPVLWLPLLGAAYSRAKESTCDRHGRACCESPESAARAMLALAAGQERWQTVDLPAYEAQASLARGFWMSYHELTSGYPWLTKRVARILHPDVEPPGRNGFAYLFALFTPYVGRGGGPVGIVVVLAIVAVAFAVAVPAYRDFEAKARLTFAYQNSEVARRALAAYYVEKKEVPASLEAAGVPATLADGSQLSLDSDTMTLTVDTPKGQLVFTPDENPDGSVTWHCAGGIGVRAAQLPTACQAER